MADPDGLLVSLRLGGNRNCRKLGRVRQEEAGADLLNDASAPMHVRGGSVRGFLATLHIIPA